MHKTGGGSAVVTDPPRAELHPFANLQHYSAITNTLIVKFQNRFLFIMWHIVYVQALIMY